MQGTHVLLIASNLDARALQDDGDASRLPAPMQPLGLVILAVPPGRTLYGLELLAATTLAIIALSLVVWVLLVITLWRNYSVEKLLGLEPVAA